MYRIGCHVLFPLPTTNHEYTLHKYSPGALQGTFIFMHQMHDDLLCMYFSSIHVKRTFFKPKLFRFAGLFFMNIFQISKMSKVTNVVRWGPILTLWRYGRIPNNGIYGKLASCHDTFCCEQTICAVYSFIRLGTIP